MAKRSKMANQSKILYEPPRCPVRRHSWMDYLAAIPGCDLVAEIVQNPEFQLLKNRPPRDMQLPNGAPDIRKILRAVCNLNYMRDDVFFQLLIFISRIVFRNGPVTNLKDGQFVLDENRAWRVFSYEFRAFLNDEWDRKQASHPFFMNDPSLCIAALWDEFENKQFPPYPYTSGM